MVRGAPLPTPLPPLVTLCCWLDSWTVVLAASRPPPPPEEVIECREADMEEVEELVEWEEVLPAEVEVPSKSR